MRMSLICLPVSSIIQLTVEDADHGSNSQVTVIVNSDKFAVNSSTGVLYTTQPLDREKQAHYHLTVQATDGGGEAAKVTYYRLGFLIFGSRYDLSNNYSASVSKYFSEHLKTEVHNNTRILNIRYWILYSQTCEKAVDGERN